MPGIHESKRVLDYWIKKIECSKEIGDRNRQLILNFYKKCACLGLTHSRSRWYLAKLFVLARMSNKTFSSMRRSDVEEMMTKIEGNDKYKELTKWGYRITVKKFFQILSGYDWKSKKYPKIVEWIGTTVKNPKREPEEILTKEEILRLIDATQDVFWKAFISLLYESGCRIGELIDMKIKHVNFDEEDDGVTISVVGKTGQRQVGPLYYCVPYLSNWIRSHPFRTDTNYYLWIDRKPNRMGKEVSYSWITKKIKDIAKRIGIQKPVNLHAFRRARATHVAPKLSSSVMNRMFGWVEGSKSSSHYIFLSNEAVRNAIMRMYGKIPKDDKEIETKTCMICKQINDMKAQYCKICGTSLDHKVASSIIQNEQQMLRLMTPEIIEKMIEQKVKELLAKH
jgi:integrase